jgi:hypothetical protein
LYLIVFIIFLSLFLEVQVLFWAPSIKNPCNSSFVEPSAAVEKLAEFDPANDLPFFSLGLKR